MGIKFKGKLSAGLSSSGDIAKRELHINLVDDELYTSSDDANVLNLTMNSHGYLKDTGKPSYAPDIKAVDFFHYVLTEDTNISTLLNFENGKTGIIQIDQDAIGGHSVAFDASYMFANGNPTIMLNPYERMVFDYKISVGMIMIKHIASYDTTKMTP